MGIEAVHQVATVKHVDDHIYELCLPTALRKGCKNRVAVWELTVNDHKMGNWS